PERAPRSHGDAPRAGAAIGEADRDVPDVEDRSGQRRLGRADVLPPGAHRHRHLRALHEGERAAHGRRLLQRRLPVHRCRHRREHQRHDWRRGAGAAAGERPDEDRAGPWAPRRQGGAAARARHARDCARSREGAQGREEVARRRRGGQADRRPRRPMGEGLHPARRVRDARLQHAVMARIIELNRKAGVSYALTDDGLELPVIDVTHPAFASARTDAERDALPAAFHEMMARSRNATEEQQAAMRSALAGSILGRGMLAGTGTFLSGVNTYLMKIGPDNLGSYAIELDRQIARAIGPVSMRMRLQDVAGFIADGLGPALHAAPGAPLHMINIAGGPAIDSLNALILLLRDQPLTLSERSIHVHVFDQDTSGPAFGARALKALMEPGAKLHGLDVTFRHVHYDWRQTDTLARDLSTLDLENAVWAASS